MLSEAKHLGMRMNAASETEMLRFAQHDKVRLSAGSNENDSLAPCLVIRSMSLISSFDISHHVFSGCLFSPSRRSAICSAVGAGGSDFLSCCFACRCCARCVIPAAFRWMKNCDWQPSRLWSITATANPHSSDSQAQASTGITGWLADHLALDAHAFSAYPHLILVKNRVYSDQPPMLAVLLSAPYRILRALVLGLEIIPFWCPTC